MAGFRRALTRLSVCAAALLCWASAALACPNCKDTIEANSQQQNIAAGYYYSILFMLSMPFLIVGVFGGCMYLAVKRAKAESGTRKAEQEVEA
jgi:hypothetical protein